MNLLTVTSGTCLRTRAERQPHEIALIDADTGRVFSWALLQSEVDAVAAGFVASGLKKGDRLGIWSANSPEFVILYLAAARLGIIVVCINFHFKQKEMEELLSEAQLNALCFSEGFRDNRFNPILTSLAQKNARGLPALLISIYSHPDAFGLSLSDLKGRGKEVSALELSAMESSVECHDPVVILLTSGSTARPKRVLLSHHNIINNAKHSSASLNVTEEDVLCLVVPFFHCFGLVSGLYFSLLTGCQLVMLRNYHIEDLLKTIQRYKCTVLHGVPTIFNRLIHHNARCEYDISSLKKGILAGAHCPPSLVRNIYSQLEMDDISVCWGQTETSPCCTQTLINDPLETKCNSIGKPLPFVEMKVINTKNGEQCGCGIKGEMCTRGYHVMQGYDGDPQQTAQVIDSEGWFHTGDIGYVDVDGYYHYVLRKKEVIIRGGENVSPREIEDAILEYPAIDSAFVFGMSSEELGEEIAAAVCVKINEVVSESALTCFLRQRLARYKLPQYIFFFSTFPLTPCGKVDVQKIRLLTAELQSKCIE